MFSNDAPGFKINVKTLFHKINAINENSKYVFVSKFLSVFTGIDVCKSNQNLYGCGSSGGGKYTT